MQEGLMKNILHWIVLGKDWKKYYKICRNVGNKEFKQQLAEV